MCHDLAQAAQVLVPSRDANARPDPRYGAAAMRHASGNYALLDQIAALWPGSTASPS
ncbi:hypothetical protein [Xanthomonas graminis]|uniref:Uncharacterized protein n=1 Tax=Xanthomonas graminis pv. phlei TaxID=487906 RepID=A0A0K2ZXS9_9XANT|nr:hypothetical protein [Xanthomonas translucens]UKE64953.1 carboxylesterase family protein [Xanthomonas translucens pv. phlei]CTP88100.1 hypothetical protein XTPLMG730_2016 [Xanthomonas translucens pv. phlei]